jgi:hypothetical protein
MLRKACDLDQFFGTTQRTKNGQDLKETEFQDVDWSHVAQARIQWRALVNTVMNLRTPLHAGTFLTSLEIVSFSRTALNELVISRHVSL